MRALDNLRDMFSRGDKVDSFLYMQARAHDAYASAKDADKRTLATERAAIKVIRRFDSDGSAVDEFQRLIEIEVRNMQ